jgi:hypothetical protein
MAGRIKALAAVDIGRAFLLAATGREFTEIETQLRLYYWAWGEYQRLKSGKPTATQEALEGDLIWTKEHIAEHRAAFKKYVNAHGSVLCGILINAINDRDSSKIFEIGRAVDFLKTFSEQGDRYRTEILLWKQILDKKGEKCPVRRLARLVRWPEKDSANGFWTLRRMAAELKFPLEPSTQIAGK